MKLRKITAILIVFLFMLCAAPITAAAKQDVAALPEGSFTRGDACALILSQASKYRPDISAQDVMKGYGDGTLRENNPVSRIELLAMLSRAFGELPEPAGGMGIMLPEAVELAGTPEWARTDASNIVGARILTEAPPLEESAAKAEAELLIQRIHSILGTSLSDDYYTVVNKQFIKDAAIDSGYASESVFRAIEREVDNDVRELVDSILLSGSENNTPKQKITDYYNNYLNFEERDKQGVEPIQKHIDAIMGAETLDGLADAIFGIDEELGISLLASFEIGGDIIDSNKKIMYFGTSEPSLEKDFYQDADNRELFITYLENIFKIAGLGDDFINYAPGALYGFEKELSEYKLEPQDYYNPDKRYNLYTFDELQAVIPNLDLKRLLSVFGYETPPQIVVMDKAMCEKFGSVYTEENLELLKAKAVRELLALTAGYLDTAFEEERISFNQKLYGVQGEKEDEQKALDAVKEMFSEYLSEMYVEKYFSVEERADVERMCTEIIGEYKQRISDLDWMSDATKAKARKKLETMVLNVGYPNKFDTRALDNADFKSFEEGGSLFDNKTAVRLELRKISALEQFSPVDKELWDWPVYEVNAFYYPEHNSINFPAGILRAPFYDIDAKAEANYGGLGTVIGHEISHAFDNNGAKFDENGNRSDWWTKEDYSAFEALLGDLISAYDGFEVYPGITINGTLTLGENVADLGGLSVALSVIGTFDNPDYDTFFRSYGISEANVMYRSFMEYIIANDVHSLSKARVNIPLGNLGEFYETYDVDENDYMYVAPEKRVKIW